MIENKKYKTWALVTLITNIIIIILVTIKEFLSIFIKTGSLVVGQITDYIFSIPLTFIAIPYLINSIIFLLYTIINHKTLFK